MHRNVFRLFAMALVVLLAVGCQKKMSGTSDTKPVLGTNVTITLYDPGLTAENAGALLKEAFGVLADWDKMAFKPGPDNQVAKISTGAGSQSVPVDDAVFEMLTKALKYYDASNKAFDIRYGPMLDTWDFDRTPRVPTPAQIDSAKGLVSTGGLFVAGHSILLAKKGMRFDVREIVVGYAFDMAAAKLAEKGVRTAMISTTEVCRTIGDPPSARGFPWAVSNPLDPTAQWATLWVPVGGAAYAAKSEGRFQSGGKAYHSLLDPRTGYPADKCAAAIVQSADAATAQAMAYAVFVWGGSDSLETAGKSAVNGAIIVREQGGALNNTISGSLSGRLESHK